MIDPKAAPTEIIEHSVADGDGTNSQGNRTVEN